MLYYATRHTDATTIDVLTMDSATSETRQTRYRQLVPNGMVQRVGPNKSVVVAGADFNPFSLSRDGCVCGVCKPDQPDAATAMDKMKRRA